MTSCLRFLILLPGLLLLAAPVQAQSEYPEWKEAFEIYQEDPVAGGDLVIELGQAGTDELPPAALTVLGDAYLRRGNYGTARKMFLRALEDPTARSIMGPGKAPIASHAEFGLALAAASAGKLGDAREWFAEASNAGGDMGYLATLGHAQAALALGRHDEALEILEALSEAEGVEPSLVDVARFATANALLDAGEFDAAAESFEALAADSQGDISTDAAYAAALAKNRAGGQEEALAAWSALVEACPPSTDEQGEEPRRISRAERELDPAAVLQSWVVRYREQPFSVYARGPSAAFSLRGCELAVESISVIESVPAAVAAPPPPAREGSPLKESPRGPDEGADARVEEVAPSTFEPSPTETAEDGIPWVFLLSVVGAVGVLGWLWRRR